MFWRKAPKLEFLCLEDDLGIIPEPYPARKYMPDWFKAIPAKIDPGLNSSTVKRCPPFLDAMVAGWIIPLAADVEIKTNHDASGVEYKWTFHKTMIENHAKEQVTSEKCPAPHDILPPMKWTNFWAIKCPPGYSILFTPPFNRPEPRFTCFTGIVDCDGYFEFVNFPFTFNIPNWHGVIEAGTPLVQVIPIKRDTFDIKSVIRAFNQEDHKELNKTRLKRNSHKSLYRDSVWERK